MQWYLLKFHLGYLIFNESYSEHVKGYVDNRHWKIIFYETSWKRLLQQIKKVNFLLDLDIYYLSCIIVIFLLKKDLGEKKAKTF